ncbi:MAG: glycosyltransferase [Chitinispirillales bacterium]|jgi:hypothetical protein|nr:glycosyltransferase [Chitinispirillales bacterium]
MANKKIRGFLLSFWLTRELSFFIYGKKVYKKTIDKKIVAFIKGRRKLSEKRIDHLIISLTSFPQRISEIKYTIYSLLDQTILPEKIILWLAESQFPNKEHDLPEELLSLRKFGLLISWCEDIRSYKKLIPALEWFPKHYIATADDDLYYKKTWLEKLWLEHLKYPDDLICHLGAKILFNDKKVLPYTQWIRYIKGKLLGERILVCSGGGALYHKRYLHNDICKKELFLNLAPYADDLWFYFMTILNDTKIRVVKKPCFKIKYVDPYREYGLNNEYTLSTNNLYANFNDKQLQNIIEHYHINLYSLTNKSIVDSSLKDVVPELGTLSLSDVN